MKPLVLFGLGVSAIAIAVCVIAVVFVLRDDQVTHDRRPVTTLVVTCGDGSIDIDGPKDGPGVVVAVVDPACLTP